jgi:hypothetical protein
LTADTWTPPNVCTIAVVAEARKTVVKLWVNGPHVEPVDDGRQHYRRAWTFTPHLDLDCQLSVCPAAEDGTPRL